MLDRVAFEYVIVRVVPRVEREEFVNAGVVVFSEARDYLDAVIELDEARLCALCNDVDLEVVGAHLAIVPLIARGGPGAGPIGELPLRERWRWLASTRSTIVQTSLAHAGVCTSPEQLLAHLVATVVRVGEARDTARSRRNPPADS